MNQIRVETNENLVVLTFLYRGGIDVKGGMGYAAPRCISTYV